MWWPEGDGWMPMLYRPNGADSPSDYVEIEVIREGWKESQLQEPEDNPQMNAIGLFWRPAGPKRSLEVRLAKVLEAFMRINS